MAQWIASYAIDVNKKNSHARIMLQHHEQARPQEFRWRLWLPHDDRFQLGVGVVYALFAWAAPDMRSAPSISLMT